jgi:hypothetical protein
MSERVEFHPLPPEPDKYETPAAKNKRLREEKESQEWQEVDLNEPEKADDKKAA